MTLGAIAFDGKRFLAVMTGSAGLALLHLFHGDSLVLFRAGVEFVMTFGAGLSHSLNMDFMTEDDISPGVLQGDVSTANGCHGASRPEQHDTGDHCYASFHLCDPPLMLL
jgi:hypothetical protein